MRDLAIIEISFTFVEEINETRKYLNQFHKEAVERRRKKIAESKRWSMSSEDAVKYMKRNMEMAEKL